MSEPGNKKKIGVYSGIAIGLGGMIGAGIFSIIGVAAEIAGNLMYVSFIIAGLLALLSGYSYSKLSAEFPSAGGPVIFLIKGFGMGVTSGFFNILLWFGYVFVLCLYSYAFASYGMTFFPGAPEIVRNILITLVIAGFTAVNIIGAKAVGSSETTIVIIKVAILLFFVVIGFFFIEPALLEPELEGPATNILFGAALVFVAYEGFGLITNTGEDMKQPRKNMPRSIYWSIAITIIIYAAVAYVVIGNLELGHIIEAKDYALAEAAKPSLGKIGFEIIAVAALFSTASAINATIYGGAYVSYLTARNNGLPKIFDKKIRRGSRGGLYITSVLVIIFANTLDLEGIAMLGSATFLVVYGAVNIAHLKVLKQTKANPFIVWAAAISCTISFFLLVYHQIKNSPDTLYVLAGVMVSALIFEYYYTNYRRKRLGKSSREKERETKEKTSREFSQH